MERITRFRAYLLLFFFVAIIAIFAFRMYDLQIIETDGNTYNASTFTTKTRVRAARGEILDRNGVVLVSNRASYDLVINHYVLLSADGTNQYLYNLIQKCQEVGVEYNESFPVSRERPFTYTLEEYSSVKQGYFQKFLAYIGDIDSDITAPLLIDQLREIYDIPASWTDDEARLVIGLRYELSLRNCITSLGNFVFVTDADDEELSAVVELNIPGMNPEASTVREIHTEYAAHIIGYVGDMTPEQWKQYKEVDGYEMDAQIGQSGLEKEYEAFLHGVDGWRVDTVDAKGTLISSYYETEPKAGKNVELSIDINLQMVAEDALAAVTEKLHSQPTGYKGQDAAGSAVVVMNMQGQVLVSASYPTYDLNNFSSHYQEILDAKDNPLFNRALMATYPPGSTYKPTMVIAGIDSGVITAEYPIYDASIYKKYAGFEPKCLYWTTYGMSHGDVNAMTALQKSCNYYFYWIGDRIRLSAMDATAKGLGLGEPTGVELPENIGHRANEETKAKLHPEDGAWYQGDQILAAIGQSDNSFSPMQLCVYATTLANRGNRYKATFLNRVVSSDYSMALLTSEPVILSSMEISDSAYRAYREGMRMVAHVQSGTAYSTFKNYPITICAKTGTAEVTGQRSANGAFICFAPYDDPQIAIAIYGEKAGAGSTLATVAKEILDTYFQLDEPEQVVINENQLS
ncbi:MAG: hypothetical protein IKW10_01075 [Oscillospiraceae bacterium]|nr:hypothetical protein [Oscillospiraceae bacterium]